MLEGHREGHEPILGPPPRSNAPDLLAGPERDRFPDGPRGIRGVEDVREPSRVAADLSRSSVGVTTARPLEQQADKTLEALANRVLSLGEKASALSPETASKMTALAARTGAAGVGTGVTIAQAPAKAMTRGI
jgi:hypothetical protein